MKKLILLVLMLPMVALSDPQPWMKKENPNELGSVHRVSPLCGISENEIRELINGVLVRSRIKPGYDVSGLHLFVDLQCGEKDIGTSYAWAVDVEFASRLVGRDSSIDFRYGYFGNSTFGVGDKQDVIAIAKRNIERTITDYLKANFDLGEDE